ncbi:MAG: hypothetical protein M1822_005986 [Bathelium mastoideum]|nr:MAG: hypothetical protein M1822_005986 [Bathelium mastoideum]
MTTSAKERSDPKMPDQPFAPGYRIGIIGAGLVGLVLAIILRQAGYQVQLFDQDEELKEVGAGIILPPNACRVFKHIGILARIEAKAVSPRAWVTHMYSDGSVLSSLELDPNMQDTYGVPFLVIYRPDLRQILVDEAVAQGAEIHFGARINIKRSNFTDGILRATNGSSFEVNLAVAADGQQSEARAFLSGRENAPKPTGRMVNRVLIDPATMRRLGMGELIDPPALHVWLGPNALAVAYFLGGVFNVALTCSSEEEPVFIGPREVVKEELKQVYQDWNWQIKSLIQHGHGFLKWLLYDVENKPESWISLDSLKCPLVLIGDAAHAIGPYIGVGAALGFESASVLGYLLSQATSEADILPTLHLYESRRKPRTDLASRVTQKMGQVWLLPDGPLQAERDRLFRTENPPLAGYPNALEDPFFQEWLYVFDGKSQAEEEWKKYKMRGATS